MNGEPGTEQQAKALWSGIADTVQKVITNPLDFFRSMPKTGGFASPLIFMVVMAAVSGVIRAVLGMLHIGFAGSTMHALSAIVVAPVMAAVFGFVAAAILFIIWKLMGSQEPFETAYRCAAYASAISPIAAVFGAIPYVGGLVGLAWGLWLLVCASVEVHKIAAKTAWLVFGILTLLFAASSVSAQIKMRRFAKDMSKYQRSINGAVMGAPDKEMTPEEAGRAAAAFMKGMQDAAAERAAQRSGRAQAGADAGEPSSGE